MSFVKFLFVAVFTLFSFVEAYNQVLSVRKERNENNSVDFFYDKSEHGSFIIKLLFSNISNAINENQICTVNGSSGKFFTLHPLDDTKPIGFSYRVVYLRGVAYPKVDTSFVYMLPFSEGKKVSANRMTNVTEKYFGGITPDNWTALHFDANKGDTVFSARKGMVIDVVEDFEAVEDKSHSFKSQSNYIVIEHDDGTFAKYGVLQKGSVMVHEGQMVLPHTPIAMVGTYDEEKYTQLRFYVYYISNPDFDPLKQETMANRNYKTAFIDPVFCTTEGDCNLINRKEYETKVDEKMIYCELNKRQLKRLEKGKPIF